VLGDDNIIMSRLPKDDLAKIVAQIEQNASRKFGMTLNLSKSAVHSKIEELEVLSYKIGDKGTHPEKDSAKLLAQLLFPERKFRKELASYRAIGIAYANCGNSEVLHDICKEIFYEYYNDRLIIDNESDLEHLRKVMPGSISWMPEIFKQIDFTREQFISIKEIRDSVSQWKGYLGYQPRFRKEHFVFDPDHPFNDTF